MNRLLLGLAGVVVLAGLVVGGILFLRDSDEPPPTDYDQAIEDDFMATCTADADALGFTRSADFCGCAYDGIREAIPFDRFLEIDAALQADPSAVPDQVDRIRTSCYLRVEAAGISTVPEPPATTEP
jgi:hypothetical protein